MTEQASIPGMTREKTSKPAKAADAIRCLIYRSRARAGLDPMGLGHLVRHAQSANRERGVSGVLVHDRGTFLQVLEGAPDQVAALSGIIRRDNRHHGMDVVSDCGRQDRAFADWDMHLATRVGGPAIPGARPLHPHTPLLTALDGAPEIIPDLLGDMSRRLAGDADRVWLPERDPALRAQALVRLLLDTNGDPDPARVDALVAEIAPDAQGFATLLEEATQALGDLWAQDNCDGFSVSLSLSGLQGVLRRRRLAPMSAKSGKRSWGTALVAAAPGEPHVLGALLKADLLRSAGWRVDLALPGPKALANATGCEISRRLARRRYDALVLATSRVFSRADRMNSLSDTVARARQVTRGNSLRVIVGGLDFGRDQRLAATVGADAACASVANIDNVLCDALQPVRVG